MTQTQWFQLAQFLIPILTPLLISAIKALIPHLPTAVIPILAPIIGAIGAAVSGVTDPSTGAVLGLAGVGAREVVDQARQTLAANAAKPPA